MSDDAISKGEILEKLGDVNLNISCVIGNANASINDLASCEILTLDRSVGDNIDILVNGALFAKGELFTKEGKLCIKVHKLHVR